jgi:hydrogenase maturation protein HypF
MSEKLCFIIRAYGIVQGVGFRPFICRLAQQIGLAGSVCNKGPYVEIMAEGSRQQLDDFLQQLPKQAPERAAILCLEAGEAPLQGANDFKIIESSRERGQVFVSPDIAICPKCQRELFDSQNKRYLHPFINCTACGPRLTILDSMPYDRQHTSMAAFAMCEHCQEEYSDPACRRYHAQPLCCHDCGPQLYLVGSGKVGTEALLVVRDIIRGGGIAAIKGIGGFHLCCDATNSPAVKRLRRLKCRPSKPFAVMLRDLDVLRRECRASAEQEALLQGPQKPIVLVERNLTSEICKEVAPGNPQLGVMLPYAPLHLLLFSYPDDKEMPDSLVMTSGNVSGAPICCNDEEARAELSSMCDVILSNDRPIRLRADDSVMAFFADKPYMIRRSRGYAPLPVFLSQSYKGQVLAVGGELKNTFCLAHDNLCYLSPYIGDLSDTQSVQALSEAIDKMQSLLEIKPQLVACDLHPGYNSTAFAGTLGLPLLPVQHHFAHIAACIAENDHRGEVIGVAFDGTGYGSDGSIWGGEFLQSSYAGFKRLGSIMPFSQAGGAAAIKEGWRIAVSVLLDILGSEDAAKEIALELGLCDEEKINAQFLLLRNNINCLTSTSAGRLFDAASAILGCKYASTFAGEAAMALEYLADKTAGADILPQTETMGDGRFAIKTDAIFRHLLKETMAGADKAVLAGYFHSAMARMVYEGCHICRQQTGFSTVALSGGVFQNLLLLQKCCDLLRQHGFEVLTHSLVPPNDGGIALGQAAVALAKINSQQR